MTNGRLQIEQVGEHNYLIRVAEGDDEVEFRIRATPTALEGLGLRAAQEPQVAAEAAAFVTRHQLAVTSPRSSTSTMSGPRMTAISTNSRPNCSEDGSPSSPRPRRARHGHRSTAPRGPGRSREPRQQHIPALAMVIHSVVWRHRSV